MNVEKVSSGINHLDTLIDSLHIGDNVILQVEAGTFVELFCLAFIKASLRDKKNVIFINFNNSPKSVIAKMGDIVNNKNITLVDCFTSGKGENSDLFVDLYKTIYKKYKCKIIHVEKPNDVSSFIKIINKIEETKPRGTRYIIDSITGMQDLWGGQEQILKFFTRQCPRLYELETIAYWILEKNAHSEEFRAQLNHITQVVIDLSLENGICNLTIVKAEKRFTSKILKPQRYEIVNSKIEFVLEEGIEALNIGRKIREIRQEKEISQAELAEKIGVTPSTISQVESNSISLSLPALLRLAKVLNVSFETLLNEKHASNSHFLFRVKNRSPIKIGDFSQKKITGEALIPTAMKDKTEVCLVNILPETVINRHIFTHKGEEFAFLISGVLELEMGERKYIMNEGDIIHLTSDVPKKWENNSDKPAKILWMLVK